jgi:hypothetical protein
MRGRLGLPLPAPSSGQATLAARVGLFDPAHAGAVAEWGSRGGQAAVAQSAGIHDPAHAGAVAKGRSRGGQAAAAAGGQRAGGLASGEVRAQQSEVAQLQAEQEARGGPAATLDGVHQARCDGARLIGLVRKDASACLAAVAAVAEEAAVAAMQAFSAEQPLPQQPMPVFPGYNSRGRSLEEMQESARLNLNDGRSLEQMQERARRNLPGSRSLQSMQESARLHLNDHRSLEEMQASMQRVNAQYSREKHQAAGALSWAKRRAPK